MTVADQHTVRRDIECPRCGWPQIVTVLHTEQRVSLPILHRCGSRPPCGWRRDPRELHDMSDDAMILALVDHGTERSLAEQLVADRLHTESAVLILDAIGAQT